MVSEKVDKAILWIFSVLGITVLLLSARYRIVTGAPQEFTRELIYPVIPPIFTGTDVSRSIYEEMSGNYLVLFESGEFPYSLYVSEADYKKINPPDICKQNNGFEVTFQARSLCFTGGYSVAIVKSIKRTDKHPRCWK